MNFQSCCVIRAFLFSFVVKSMFTQNVVQCSVSCPEVIVGPFESGFGNVEAGVGALSGSFVCIT